jgi:hypothetical protein
MFTHRLSEAYFRESMKFILGANFRNVACRKVPQSEPGVLKNSLRDRQWKGLCKKYTVMMSELYLQRDSFHVSSLIGRVSPRHGHCHFPAALGVTQSCTGLTVQYETAEARPPSLCLRTDGTSFVEVCTAFARFVACWY